IGPAPEGLSFLPLAVEDAALARPDFADLRIVDGESRQWPYLLEEGAEAAWVPLEVERTPRPDGRSAYRFRAPDGPLRVARLRLRGPERFSDRTYIVFSVDTGRAVPLDGGSLVARGEPLVTEVTFPEHALDGLELIVHDGDDAPLELSADARASLPRLWIAA